MMEAITDRLHSGSDSPLQPRALERLGAEIQVLRPAIISAVQMHDARWSRILRPMNPTQRSQVIPSALHAMFFVAFDTGPFDVRGEDRPREEFVRLIKIGVVAHNGRYWVQGGDQCKEKSHLWQEVAGGFKDLDAAVEGHIARALDELEKDMPSAYRRARPRRDQRLGVPKMDRPMFSEGTVVFDGDGRLLEFRDELEDQKGRQEETPRATEAKLHSRRTLAKKWTLPEGTTGLRLCKMRGEELVLYEEIQFQTGIEGADTTLRRAEIAGKVGPVGETGDFWADIFNKDSDLIESIALDRNSWNALKNRWMRCKVAS